MPKQEDLKKAIQELQEQRGTVESPELGIEDLFDFIQEYSLFTEGSRILLFRDPKYGAWTISVIHPDHFIGSSNETFLVQDCGSALPEAIKKAISGKSQEAFDLIQKRERWLEGEMDDLKRLKSKLGAI